MEKKLLKFLKFDEIVTVLKHYAFFLEEWNVEYEEDLSKEINDLYYIINHLECFQDDLIVDFEKGE